MDIAILIVGIIAALGTFLAFLIFRHNKCEKKRDNAIKWAESNKEFIINHHRGRGGYSGKKVVESVLKSSELKSPYIIKDCYDIGGNELATLVEEIANDLRALIDENRGISANEPSTALGLGDDSINTLEAHNTIFLDEILKIRCRLLKFW